MRAQLSLLSLTCALMSCWPQLSAAHVMVSQYATLRFQAQGAYLLAAFPVSALTGFDEDGDGLMSERELQLSAAQLKAHIKRHIQLLEGERPLSLDGLLLNLSQPHGARGPSAELLVMGRFALPQGTGEPVSFRARLYSAQIAEPFLKIRVSREELSYDFTLTPKRSLVRLDVLVNSSL